MKLASLLLAILLCTACTAKNPGQTGSFVPESAPSPAAETGSRCRSCFPAGSWQFVHLISFTMADGTTSSVLGITVLNGGIISCALTTLEGLTLFEARSGNSLEIMRAVPPFDTPSFATGLLQDVQALFIGPTGNIQPGYCGQKTPCCQITTPDNTLTDIIPFASGCWQIRTYSPAALVTRTITAKNCRQQSGYRLAQELTLTVPGTAGYTLHMTLLEARPLSDTQPR